MSDASCGNCGSVPSVVPCASIEGPHTHPKAWNDLTPVPCDLWLCGKCERRVRRNIARANVKASERWAEAAFADPDTRARLEAAVERTRTTDPVPDDFSLLAATLADLPPQRAPRRNS